MINEWLLVIRICECRQETKVPGNLLPDLMVHSERSIGLKHETGYRCLRLRDTARVIGSLSSPARTVYGSPSDLK